MRPCASERPSTAVAAYTCTSDHLASLKSAYFLLALTFIPFQVAKLNAFSKVVYLVCLCITHSQAVRSVFAPIQYPCSLPRKTRLLQFPACFLAIFPPFAVISLLLDSLLLLLLPAPSSPYFKHISCAREFVLKDICSLKMCLLVLCIF